jgi:hypothetical protein
MANEINNTGNNKKRKWIFFGLGILAATGLSIFGYRYYKKNKLKSLPDNSAPAFKAEKPKNKPLVKTATKKKTTSNTGAKTASSSSAKPQSTAPPIDAKAIAKAIHTAALKKDFTKVYAQLRNIRSSKDYNLVSKAFSTMPLNGVRQTLVNGLLNTFKDANQKNTLNKSFKAMGLKYSDKTKKWSLSGFGEALIITTQNTKVWKDPKTSVPVPTNMILGAQVCKRGAFTLFENDKQFFLVETTHIKPYTT